MEIGSIILSSINFNVLSSFLWVNYKGIIPFFS
jgi:hypothetical protein